MKTTPVTTAIVDDHSLFRNGIASILSHAQGITVTLQAANGQQLLDKLNDAAQPPDICLLDINMPVMNGYETMAALNRHYPGIKVIAISMYTNEYPVIKMLAEGACAYVSKDTSPNELEKVISFVAEHGYYYQGVTAGYLPHGVSNIKSYLPGITNKEMQFLQLSCTDMSYNDIAAKLNVSVRTVENYRDSLFRKLNTRNRLGVAIFAIRSGLAGNASY